MWARRVVRHAAAVAATALIGGFAGASLMLFGPGYGAGEELPDSRLSAETAREMRRERRAEGGAAWFYASYLRGLPFFVEKPVATSRVAR